MERNESSMNLAALKDRQQAAWTSGNYAVVGTTLQIVGEDLCEALDLRSGQKVLDVAAGNGNATLAAARRWCEVVSTDYVSKLLQLGELRANAEGLDIEFKTADAEALPFGDASFDVVLSTFGVMFTANHAKAADELFRVCKPGGKIGMANWTPEGFIGQMFKVIGRHVAPPPGAKSPSLWGTAEQLKEWFASRAESVVAKPRHFTFRYLSPEHFLETFKTFYGPMLKAFLTLDPNAQQKLDNDVLALIDRFNRAKDGTMVAPSEYLEIVVKKHST
jgi:ubiquinone/menaquinone biosynthesis C-methylase UbiE